MHSQLFNIPSLCPPSATYKGKVVFFQTKSIILLSTLSLSFLAIPPSIQLLSFFILFPTSISFFVLHSRWITKSHHRFSLSLFHMLDLLIIGGWNWIRNFIERLLLRILRLSKRLLMSGKALLMELQSGPLLDLLNLTKQRQQEPSGMRRMTGSRMNFRRSTACSTHLRDYQCQLKMHECRLLHWNSLATMNYQNCMPFLGTLSAKRWRFPTLNLFLNQRPLMGFFIGVLKKSLCRENQSMRCYFFV